MRLLDGLAPRPLGTAQYPSNVSLKEFGKESSCRQTEKFNRKPRAVCYFKRLKQLGRGKNFEVFLALSRRSSPPGAARKPRQGAGAVKACATATGRKLAVRNEPRRRRLLAAPGASRDLSACILRSEAPASSAEPAIGVNTPYRVGLHGTPSVRIWIASLAPEGHLIIAQRFIAGCRGRIARGCPVGTPVPRSHALRGNAPAATLCVASLDAERRERGSHAERGNQEGGEPLPRPPADRR